MRIVVHLSDLHFGRVDPRLVPPLVRTIHAIAPHLVAISGDLTQRASRRQFEQARAFLQQLPFQKLIVPGNHDVPLYNIAARFLSPFGPYRRYIQRDLEPVLVDEDMIVAGLNSARTIPFGGGGRLNTRQVERATRDHVIEQAVRKYVERVEHYCRLAPYNWFNFYDYWI